MSWIVECLNRAWRYAVTAWKELGETTRGCAEVNGGVSGGEEIVKLRSDICLERKWRSQKFGAGP